MRIPFLSYYYPKSFLRKGLCLCPFPTNACCMFGTKQIRNKGCTRKLLAGLTLLLCPSRAAGGLCSGQAATPIQEHRTLISKGRDYSPFEIKKQRWTDNSKTRPFERLLQHFTEITSPKGAVRREEETEWQVM